MGKPIVTGNKHNVIRVVLESMSFVHIKIEARAEARSLGSFFCSPGTGKEQSRLYLFIYAFLRTNLLAEGSVPSGTVGLPG